MNDSKEAVYDVIDNTVAGAATGIWTASPMDSLADVGAFVMKIAVTATENVMTAKNDQSGKISMRLTMGLVLVLSHATCELLSHNPQFGLPNVLEDQKAAALKLALKRFRENRPKEGSES